MRAAFKAIDSGRQVGVLVPTTVLAEQHYRTFTERMAEYPFSIEVLSRFRTRGEQKKVLEGLASGQVDLVIGTHRLIQPDVKFSDLGLLVIDEEQRFGVEAKEMLKKLRLEAGRADAERHPHPADAAPVAPGDSRHLEPADPAARPAGDRNPHLRGSTPS